MSVDQVPVLHGHGRRGQDHRRVLRGLRLAEPGTAVLLVSTDPCSPARCSQRRWACWRTVSLGGLPLSLAFARAIAIGVS